MFTKIKETIKDDDFRFQVKTIASSVVTGLVVGAAVKLGTYIVVEGTKALVLEIQNEINSRKELAE